MFPNFNFHIHVIIVRYVIDKKSDFKKFMKLLLDKMEKYFKKDRFKETKNQMYLEYKNNFYVNNKL